MAVNTERLLDLIAVLREVKPENFDINNWKCGTSACAAGHYCLARPQSGLTLDAKPYRMPLDADGNQGFLALEVHFGLSAGQADYLFNNECYRDEDADAADVIARVEQILCGQPIEITFYDDDDDWDDEDDEL